MGAFDKIGLHVIAGGIPAEKLATAPVLCLVDCSVEYINEVRAANPTAWIVVRWVYQGDQNAALRDPEKAADAWWAERQAAIMATKGPRTVYQGMNEIGSGISDLYVRYEERRAGHLWGVGAGFGLGAWSVGEPDYPVWPRFWRVLQGMGAGDALLLHEYWADASDLGKRWYTARWTDERVWPMVRGRNIIVTECGRDKIGARGQPGWRLTINAETFLMEVARYNELLNQTPDVKGGCLFTGGVLGEWRDFDANQLWPRIVATQERGEPVTVEPLPEHETARDPETIAEKIRWYTEEVLRRLEQAGEPPESYAMRVLYGLTDRERGLMYRLERILKGYVDTSEKHGDGVDTYWRPPQSE